MSKEKESGTLLGVGTAYLPTKEIKGELYVKVSDFTRCMNGIRIEQEADRKHIEQLEEENKKLKHENSYRAGIVDILPKGKGHIAEESIQDLQKEIKLLKMSLEEKDENCYGLAKENKKLKSDLAYERTMLDNVRAEYESSQDVIKNLKEERDEYKERWERSFSA